MTTTDTQQPAATPQRTAPAGVVDEQAGEFRLDIVTDPDAPTTIVWFRADGIAAAIAQARRFLAAHDGPEDLYGELYQRNGNRGDFLTTLHLGA